MGKCHSKNRTFGLARKRRSFAVPHSAAPGLVSPITKGKQIVEQMDRDPHAVSRRSLLKLIGTTAGSGMMYETMVAMGYAGTSDFNGPIKLSGDVEGRFGAGAGRRPVGHDRGL